MWRARRNAISIAVCLAGTTLLVLVQRTVDEPSGGVLTSLIFLSTVLIASISGGLKSGLSATFLGVLSALLVFSPSYLERAAASSSELLRLIPFLLLGVTISVVFELLLQAWKRVEDRQLRLEMEVTERQRAQLAEQTRADELMTTLASIGDGVIRTDCEGRVTYLNPVAESLTGWTSDAAAGQLLAEIFQIVNETTRQAAENPALTALRERRTVGLSNHTLLISREGQERAIDDSAAPILDSSGEIVGCVLVFRDISERRRGQKAVRESEQRYRAIGESIDYGVWMCDAVGRSTYVSDSFLRLVGLTLEESASLGWGSVLHPDDADAAMEAWRKCVQTGDRWDREHRFKGVDGKWHYVLARGVPIKNDQGEVISWVGINLDINRLKEVEDELRDNDRRKDEFLATLAHELRNPLAPLSNALQIMRVPGLRKEDAERTREMMERQIHQLVRLVDDLMDVSRVMRGKIELRRDRVELAEVVTRAVETSRPLIDAHRHQLKLSLPAESLPLHVDAVRLAQVISNLLLNAAKYTEANGILHLRAWREGTSAVLSVTDNGIGIAPDVLAHIFDLFVQADYSSTKSHGGLGIGLTLVRNLVEMHGGSVSAFSEGLGKGSEFQIRIPLVVEDHLQAAEASSPPAMQAVSSTTLRLMIVDDNEDAAGSLAMLCELWGHEVRVASSGAEALQMIANVRPHLILLDIGMPTMDGYEVARRLRKMPGVEKTVLAALTGWNQTEDRRKTTEAGFDHHLVKPPEAEMLQQLIADIAANLTGGQTDLQRLKSQQTQAGGHCS